MYKTAVEKVGFVEEKEVFAIHMPREDFLEECDKVFDAARFVSDGNFDPDILREKLRPTAETMLRYPIGDWINEDRGCGCVVGEYLVARDIISRNAEDIENGNATVQKLLQDLPDGKELSWFGNEIDTQLRRRLDNVGIDEPPYNAYGLRRVIMIDD